MDREGISPPARSLNGREEPLFDQRSTDLDDVGIVHRQNGDRGPPDGGPADQVGAIPAEVPLPLVPSRVEELGELPRQRVDPGDVRPLVKVVVEAGEGQVAQRRATAVLAGDDLVDREWDRGILRLGHPAVFAGVAGPLSHRPG